jgi:DNA ligase-associated metallophosphoesterase
MTAGSLSIRVHGEELLLHPARAVIWRRCRTVIVADTHFGKSSHFGRHGIAVPAGCDREDRERLSRLVADSDARRLVILGDFLHSSLNADGAESQELHEWVQELGQSVEIQVVAGNHDRGVDASAWPEALRWCAGSRVDPPFEFVHDAESLDSEASTPRFALSGHVHPVVRLRGRLKGALRVPAFWQRAAGLVLPSFGSFTGGFAVRPAPGDRLYAVGSTSVVALGACDATAL